MLSSYSFFALHLVASAPIGKHALQEIHFAVFLPEPESHKLGRSGCRINGRDNDIKSAFPDSR